MKIQKIATVLFLLLQWGGGGVQAEEGKTQSRSLGGYTVTVFSSGKLGDEGHSSGFEVRVGDKVLMHKSNANITSDVLVNEDTLGLDGKCLHFCYGEASDGLDDSYIHAVRICGDRVDIFTAVVVDDEGIPVLKIGDIPQGWDAGKTRENIQRTFSGIFSREQS